MHGDSLEEKLVTLEDEEKERFEKKIRRQNRIIIILGIVVFVIYVVVAYLYRNLRFPLPLGYP
jgi:uncharacterized membrane protein